MTLKQKLQSLLTAANAKTSKSDADLTDAVQSLIDGYGGGGGEKIGVVHLNNKLMIYTGVTATKTGTTLRIGG